MSKLIKTSDLKVFKPHPNNRLIDKGLVSLLKTSIQKNNLLELKPIVVDSDMRVVDGQHRLQACRELNLPIWYIVNEEANSEDMILLNAASRNWVLADYLHYYKTLKKPNYVKFAQLMQKYELSVSQVLMFCSKSRHEASKDFKDGLLEDIDEKKMDIAIGEVTEIRHLIIARTPPQDRTYLKSMYFQKALLLFIDSSEVNTGVLKQKLLMKMNWLHSATNVKSYLDMLQKIYNWKNQQPIDIISKEIDVA